jgi:hypothetical protein
MRMRIKKLKKIKKIKKRRWKKRWMVICWKDLSEAIELVIRLQMKELLQNTCRIELK